MAANIKAETLVGLSRDVGLARQDTSVAFVRQPCPVPISSFFFYLIFIFIHASCSPRHSGASYGSTCSVSFKRCSEPESSRPRR